MPPTLTSARVAVVSGKGGVGKTTVAAALAVAAARAGNQVLLVEIESRRAFAPLFGIPEIGYVERRLAANLSAIEVQPDEALVEYLRLFYGIPKLPRALVQSKAIEFATNTAPGLRDILLIGKVKEAEQRRRDGSPVFDLVVLDAPPTGRLPRFLDAPRAVASLVKSGPIRRQAEGVLEMVLDPARLQVVLVTHAEEMPVRETAESIETLQKMGVAVGPVVVNGLLREVRGLGKVSAATLREQASAAGIAMSEPAVEALATVATRHARRARNQRRALAALREATDLPDVRLPYLFTERIGRAEVEALADELKDRL